MPKKVGSAGYLLCWSFWMSGVPRVWELFSFCWELAGCWGQSLVRKHQVGLKSELVLPMDHGTVALACSFSLALSLFFIHLLPSFPPFTHLSTFFPPSSLLLCLLSFFPPFLPFSLPLSPCLSHLSGNVLLWCDFPREEGVCLLHGCISSA